MKRLFQAAFGIRPDEFALVQLFFALFTAVGVAATLGLTAADTLFLSRYSAAEAERLLPAIYVGIGVVGVLASSLYDRVAARLPRRSRVVGTFLVLAASLVVYRLALRPEARSLYFALVIWIEICSLLAAAVLFSHAASIFSGRDAKRLYGYITGGLAVGAIVSGYAVDPLVERAGAEGLLVAAAAALAGAAVLATTTFRVARGRSGGEEDEGSPQGVPLSALLRNRHVLLTFAFGLGGLVCAVFGDYQLKIVASRTMDETQLAAFFGKFYAGLGVAQLLVQFLLVGWLLRRFGLLGGLLVMPLLMLGGSAGFVLWPVVLVAAGAEFVRQCFSDTMEGPSRELLFLPLPAQLRARAQIFAGGALDAGGQAAAGLVVFGAMMLLPDIRWLGVVTFAFAVAWLLAARAIRPHYEATLAESLSSDRLGGADLLPLLDSPEAPRVLRAMLTAGGGRAELALELIEARQKSGVPGALDGLVDAVAGLVAGARPGVAAAAIDRLADGEGAEIAGHLRAALADPRPAVRAAAVLAMARREGKAGLAELAPHLGDADPRVVEAAIAGALRYGGEPGREMAGPVLERLVADPDPDERRRAARALGRSGARATTMLATLLGDADPAVVDEAMRAARGIGDPALLPLLCDALATVAHRRGALAALSALPADAVPALAARAADRGRGEAERIALAGAIAAIGGAEGAAALFRMTSPEEPLLVRLEAARALRSAVDARRALAAPALDDRIEEVVDALGLLNRAAGECVATHPGIASLFADHARLHLSLLLALVELRHGGAEALRRAEPHLFSRDPHLSSNALELVDSVLPRPLSVRLSPHLAAVTAPPVSSGPGLSARTRELLAGSPSAWLRALAAGATPEAA